MRIATFNMDSFGGDRPGTAATRDHAAILRPVLDRLDADILCLQEINGQKPGSGLDRTVADLEELIATTIYAGFHYAVSVDRDGTPDDRHNLVTLSRFPIIQAESLHHDFVDPPRWRRTTAVPPDRDPAPIAWDRPALRTRIAMPGGRAITVFNVHFRAPLAAPVPGQKETADRWRTSRGWAEGYFQAAMKRIGQAVEVRHAVDACFDTEPDTHICVAGDFNADLANAPLRILMAATADTGNPDLRAQELHALEPDASTARHTLLHDGERLTPDHILVDRVLAGRLQWLEIYNETLMDDTDPNAPGPAGSVHAAIVAELELPLNE